MTDRFEKLFLLAVAMVFFISGWAVGRSTASRQGRFQVDTSEGSLWRSAFDTKTGQFCWTVPCENLGASQSSTLDALRRIPQCKDLR